MTDEQILDAILAKEGGYVDHPADRGGPTNYGITLATLSRWRGTDLTAADVQALAVTEARDIYRALYIKPFDGVDESVKPQVVDIAVNSGVARARILLARAQQQAKRPVGVQLVIERLEHYAGIVERDPAQRVFMRGWIRRALSFLALALAVACLSGCAARYTLVKEEQVGPFLVETWRDNKTRACERRAYVGWYYYRGDVACP